MKKKKFAAFMRRHRVLTRALAMMLTVIISFYVIPTVIYAEIGDAIAASEKGDAIIADVTKSRNDQAVYEDESLREVNVKHFRLSDGSYVAAQYAYPVHYVSETGELEDIDNTLAESSGGVYATPEARIKFVKETTGSSSIFTLKDGSTKLTMSLSGAKKGVRAEVTNYEDSESDTLLQKMLNLEKLSSRIIYENILDGVDLEYVIQSLSVKENIIVKERSDSYSYSFEIKLNGLRAELTEAGDIEIADEASGEIKYVIPAPIIYDASGASAPNGVGVFYLSEMGNGKYGLTVSANSEWMNSPERSFPVTIDPTVGQTMSNTYMRDTYIAAQNPDTQFYSANPLRISSTDTLYWRAVSLPAIPENAYISKASISYYVTHMPQDMAFGAHLVTSAWGDPITYNTYLNGAGAYESTYQDIAELVLNEYVELDITDAVQRWCDGTENYGVAITPVTVGDYSNDGYAAVYPIENNHSRPTLSISYRTMYGLEDYMSYSTQSAGMAGTGNVNLATGGLTFTIPTLTTTDSLMPYTPTLVYNSHMAGLDYNSANANVSYSDARAPLGMMLNTSESIKSVPLTQTTGYVALLPVYVDADGTEHYFTSDGDEENPTFYDEDGLGLVMYSDASSNFIMTDRSKTVRTFKKIEYQSGWYLTRISDRNGNAIVFDTDSLNRVTAISLDPAGATGSIQMLTLHYNSDGRLVRVYNPASREAVVLRYSATYNGDIVSSGGKFLKQMDYARGTDSATDANWTAFEAAASTDASITVTASAYYEYRSDQSILRAKDGVTDKSIIYFRQNATSQLFICEEDGDGNMGRAVYLYIHSGYSEVRSSGNDDVSQTDDDIFTRYIFDTNGRVVNSYSYSKDYPVIYGAINATYSSGSAKNSIESATVLGGSSINNVLNGGFTDSTNSSLFSYWNTSGIGVSKTNFILPGSTSEGYAAQLSPPAGTTSSISQNVLFTSRTQTLSFLYLTQNSEKASAKVEITSLDGSIVLHSEQINLNPSASNGIYSFFSTSISLDSLYICRLAISVTTDADAGESPVFIVDDVMLEYGDDPSDYSLVQCGGFDVWLENYEAAWSYFWDTQGPVDGISAPNNEIFYNSARLSSSMNSTYIKQRVFVASDEEINGGTRNNYGTDYILSGYAKAENAVLSGNSPFRLRMEIAYYQGVGQPDLVVDRYVDFLPNVKAWQFASGTIETLPEDDSKYYIIRYIDVYCEYYMQPNGDAYFDNISVTRANTNTRKYEYNDKGYLTENNGYYDSTYYIYDDNDNIIRAADTRGLVVDYTYTITGLPVDEIVSEITTASYYSYDDFAADAVPLSHKRRSTYQYNEYGLVTSIDTVDLNADGTLATSTADFRTEYTYVISADSKIFGALTKERDLSGATVCYYYDTTNGNLMAKVNISSGYGTAYTYDALGRLTSAVPALSSSDSTYTAVAGAESVEYTYSGGELVGITTGTAVYGLFRDSFGNISRVKMMGGVLATYTYNDNNGKLNKIQYGNGDAEEYVYNDLELLSEIWYTENGGVSTLSHKYEYTASGMLYKYTDYVNGAATVCKYDSSDRLVNMSEYDITTATHEYSSALYYNEDGYLSGKYLDLEYSFSSPSDGAISSISASLDYSYTYRDNGYITRQKYLTSSGVSLIMNYSYDKYDRVSSVISTYGSAAFTRREQYYYDTKSVDGTEYASSNIKQYVSTINGVQATYTYTYNSSGYISSVTTSDSSGTTTVNYYYDDLGQLVREENEALGICYVYAYDQGGNITRWQIFDYTSGSIGGEGIRRDYSYRPDDRLSSADSNALSYDSAGNPLIYHNGILSYQFAWSGKKLSSATMSGNTYTFTYDASGRLKTKTTDNNTTTYYYDGDRLISEQDSTGTTIYIYDVNGSPVGMQYRMHSYSAMLWDVYWFEKNIQGDVTAIYNSVGTKLVSYSYSAYGMCSASYHNGGNNTTAIENHLTYRGYYYDTDMRMYYLGTRWYDPVIGRFISPDSIMSGVNGSLHGFNLYVYCFNNPVNMTDASGNWPEWMEAVGKWFEENVGAAVVLEQKYKNWGMDNFLCGYEQGHGASKVLAGDADKPVVLYSTVAPENGSLADVKVGIQANVNNGGVAIESNGINTSLIMANGDASTEFMFGLNKIGLTFRYGADFGNRTADTYVHMYIRTIPCAALAGAIYYSRGAIVLIPV